MSSLFFQAKSYLNYRLNCLRTGDIHSPFVFDFAEEVLGKSMLPEDEKMMDNFRKKLLHDTRMIEVKDFGAGSQHTRSSKRVIRDIARQAGRSPRTGTWLYRLTQHYDCHEILELGTSLGIGTCYLALANPKAAITTWEGSENIALCAKDHFAQLGLGNIRQQIAPFETLIPLLEQENRFFDLIVIDGNHRYEPTLFYFKSLLPKLKPGGWMVFDDIYWSQEMKRAWQEVKQHESMNVSIDLFHFGFLTNQAGIASKQHFTLSM